MNQMLLIAIIPFLFSHVKALSPPFETSQDPNNFKPSIAVVIGILSIMFSLTFLLLLYAKFCRSQTPSVQNMIQIQDGNIILPVTRVSSGIDKSVVESLPFFRFSLLKGSREGLECAVCLSKFEDVEILRLLPKCKHAFHIDCIDQWLEKHSSCPICRHKVSAEDHSLLTYSNSFRFLRNQSELREESNLELYVQREESGFNRSSSRFSIGSISFRKSGKREEEEIPIQEQEEQNRGLDRFNHRIIVSDVVLKHRWSNVSSSDMMFLRTEMLNDITSKQFSSLERNTTGKRVMQESDIKEEMERKRLLESKLSNLESSSKVLRQTKKRSMSEILRYPRLEDFSTRNYNREPSGSLKEERRRRIWLPIATTTVQWFFDRERRFV